MTGSPYIDATISDNRQELIAKMQAGKIRGLVVIPVDFAEQMERANATAPIQVITDGSEPNTANFVQGYVEGIWQIWQMQRAEDNGQTFEPLIDVQTRYWFNPAAISQHFIIPGAVTIIMTVIGAILTSLVVAREWERGTMEALLSTEITRTELLLCKLIPYYFLGMLAMLLCMLVSVFILGVPYRGSLLILFFISSLFLLSTLGMGLLISTITRNQFNAAQVALNAAFLPSIMLSGFIFQIDSMPAVIRAVTYIIPARYFVSTLQSLFLAGNIPVVLVVNVLFLIASAVMFIGLTWPYRGSLLILFFISSLFLLSTLGMGLLISTITRNQFNAAQVALNAAFLPSIMLSGFIFQIDSMPAVIRAVTYIIPARYFVSTLQSLFLAGNIPVVLVVNVLFLIASAVMFIGLTWLKTKRRLD